MVIAPEDSTFEEGQTVLLTCVAFGSLTTPNITWNRDGLLLESGNSVNIYQTFLTEGGVAFTMSVLEICGISEDYVGVYSCMASGQNVTAVSPSFSVNVTQITPRKY